MTVTEEHVSFGIIKSTFSVFKQKKSPKKLYDITPFVLSIPLHIKLKNDYATKTFNFKERLCNVKLKDIDAFAKKHMSINWVTERTKQLKNVSKIENVKLDNLLKYYFSFLYSFLAALIKVFISERLLFMKSSTDSFNLFSSTTPPFFNNAVKAFKYT